MSVFQEEVMRADALKTTPPRAVQQLSDVQHRERQATGFVDCSRTINAAEVCVIN